MSVNETRLILIKSPPLIKKKVGLKKTTFFEFSVNVIGIVKVTEAVRPVIGHCPYNRFLNYKNNI